MMNVTILYGSETGTAQDTAEQIWKIAKRLVPFYFCDFYTLKTLKINKTIFSESNCVFGINPVFFEKYNSSIFI